MPQPTPATGALTARPPLLFLLFVPSCLCGETSSLRVRRFVEVYFVGTEVVDEPPVFGSRSRNPRETRASLDSHRPLST